MTVFAALSLIAYLFSLCLLLPERLSRNNAWLTTLRLVTLVALICHAGTIWQQVAVLQHSQTLPLLSLTIFISFVISGVMTLVALRQQGRLLLPVVYLFAAITLALTLFFPDRLVIPLTTGPLLFVHIGFALFTYAVLLIATLYALQTLWLDWRLKHKRLTFRTAVPPLLQIERKTLHITRIGTLLLTLVLLSSLITLPGQFAEKIVLSVIAWCPYGLLLWGHRRYGWRGRRIAWLNIVGITLLTLVCFGSRYLTSLF